MYLLSHLLLYAFLEGSLVDADLYTLVAAGHMELVVLAPCLSLLLTELYVLFHRLEGLLVVFHPLA